MKNWDSEFTKEEWNILFRIEQKLQKSSTEFLTFVLSVVSSQLNDRNKKLHNERRIKENETENKK